MFKLSSYRIIVTSISLAAVVLLPASIRGAAYELRIGRGFQHGDARFLDGLHPGSRRCFRMSSPGTVRLTISNANLTASENVDQFYINLNPAMNPNLLTFASAGSSGGFDAPTINEGVNAFKADGDGLRDVLLNFSTGGTDNNRFTDNEYLSYNITGISGLTANDFSYLSFPAGGHGPFYAAAHVQRIGTGGLSGWIDPTGNMITPVPEPASAALLLVGSAALFLRRRWLAV